jgi:HD-GYP domain-containing protein (c-di-GMP phosphodiesterase class II)
VRLTQVDRLRPGVQIAASIPTAEGDYLAEAGQTVDRDLINSLRVRGISRVYTRDPLTDDIEIVSVLTESTRDEAMGTVADAFAGVGSNQSLRSVCTSMIQEVRASEGAVQGVVPIYPLSDHLVAHSVYSTLHALLVAAEVNMDAGAMLSLAMGMLLHDIGSAQYQATIEVPGKLTEVEREEFQQHTRAGFELLREMLSAMPLGRSIALSHHERMDGSGYPRGLEGEDIPDLVRIASVADVFTAMISDRYHRPAMMTDEAVSYLLTQGMGKFDSDFTVALTRRVEIYPSGVWIRLRDGRAGIVLGSRRMNTVRPTVRILEDERRKPLPTPQDIDLSIHSDLFIADVFLN